VNKVTLGWGRHFNRIGHGSGALSEGDTMKGRSVRLAIVGLVATIGLVAAACAAPAAPTAKNWSVKATNITVNDAQDEIRTFGLCVAIPNCDDEPYLLQVAFQVTIGQANSAQTWVVKGDTLPSTGEGSSRALTGNQGAPVNFSVKPLDILDVFNTSNKLTVFGTYTWAAEEDTINSLTTGANGIASTFKDILNSLLAAKSLPSDANGIVNLVLDALFNNIGSLFKVIASNIPCLGLCDDVLGGAVYVGIGAGGTLGSAINSVLAGVTVPQIAIPVVSVPPDVQGGGIFTMTGGKNFSQTFSGADGTHTYSFSTGQA
jgi:hypothetical protein